jgi:hypothetical protein
MSEIIMYDSPEAARPHNMDGWLSRDGYFYAEESAARYHGCTHRPCEECGAPAEKHYTACKDCRDKHDFERFQAMPRKGWDGEAMVYSELTDTYYSDPCEVFDDIEEGVHPRLIICEPVYVSPLDINYVEGDLPDDGDLPPEVDAAMKAFNEATKGVVLSWLPGKYALEW